MGVKTCLRFPGGKFYALKYLRPFYNLSHDEYREPFVGGGSVFLDKQLATKLNWINDINKDLITFYRVIQNTKTRNLLYELLRGEEANRIRHGKVRDMVPSSDIETAFRFFYLNRTSFSGIMNRPRWGYRIGSSVKPDKWLGIIDPVANKLKGVRITNLDFREVISAKSVGSSVLLYLDPPYLTSSKAIYENEFTKDDHLDLCSLIRKTKYKFILSYEDSTEVRDLYSWAFIYPLNLRYFMSEGRRQLGKELVITNFMVSPS